MVKHLLPPLNKDGNAVPVPAIHGKWEIADNSILAQIEKSLKDVTIDEQKVKDLISIPDVWARVVVVKNATIANGTVI